MFPIACLAALTLLACSAPPTVTPSEPQCLRLVDFANPLGVDEDRPRLGWVLAAAPAGGQSAYEVHVASRPDSAAPDVWTSGKVAAADAGAIYDGPTLVHGQRYYWSVRIWDGGDTPSAWAPESWWEMSPRTDADWDADWIGAETPPDTGPRSDEDLLRRSLTLAKPIARARAYVIGLGYVELSINGSRVGDHVLDPGWTDYSQRALYSSYDVTDLVVPGANAIGVSLGPGWFGGISSWGSRASAWDGRRRLRLRLVVDHTDGSSTVATSRADGTWRTALGPTVDVGTTPDAEQYDARLAQPGWNTPGFDDAKWSVAVAVAVPEGAEIRSQGIEAITASKPFAATVITRPRAGSTVYDFGRNIAGWTRLRVSGPAGTTVTLRYGERLGAVGLVDPGYRSQLDSYVLRGGGDEETWEPRYSYKGFQYVQVDGYPGKPGPDDVQARRIHSAVHPIGTFESSSPLLTTIHAAVISSTLNNNVSVPTDGSMIEKLPWTGDAGLMTDSAFTNFDMRRLYTKWLVDIEHSQDDTGNIGSWAPQPPGQFREPSAAWGHQYLVTAWNLYRYYGDAAPMRAHYASMKRYFAFEIGRLDESGISREQWGDYLGPSGDDQANRNLVGTAYVVRSAQLLATIADALHETQNAIAFTARFSQLRDTFNANYFDPVLGLYRSDPALPYRQTPNVLALAFGFVAAEHEAAVVANLVHDVEETHGGHLDTGVLGTKYLLPVLSEHGYIDLAYRVATAETYPSWGFWFANGATSLWEMWKDSRSLGHWFMGTIDDWLYQHLAGIKVGTAGYGRIDIKPYLPTGLSHAGATIETERGTVASHWTQGDGGEVTLDVTVPSTTTARVHVPTSTADRVEIDGKPAGGAAGVAFRAFDNGYAVYDVQAGTYRFVATRQ